MSLTVDVLPLSPLALVRARVVAAGPWVLEGQAAGHTWKVAEGSGDGWLSDPWAPLNEAVTYTLTAGSSVETSGPVVRPYGGWHAVTDLRGRSVVDFLWMKSGGDPAEQALRQAFFDVPGSRMAPYMAAPVAGAGGGSLTARTVRGSSRAMRDLVAANAAVILHHNEKRCRIGECDVPRVRTVLLTAAPEDLTSRMDVAERSWPLSYRLVPSPWGFIPPVATVADFRARFPTVADVQSSGLTVGDIQSGGWLVDL